MYFISFKILITWATCGRPSLGLPFHQYIYLSIYHVTFGKITQKSLHIALMSSSELLVVFSFAEKAFEPSFVETEKSFKQLFQVF